MSRLVLLGGPAVLVLDDGPRVGVVLVERCLDFGVVDPGLNHLDRDQRPEAELPRPPSVESCSGSRSEDDDEKNDDDDDDGAR